MDALSAATTLKALDGLSLRAEAAARNIANAQTPNYRAVRVSFEAALTAAAAKGSGAVDAVQPRVVPALDGLAGEVRLDQEMATATSTALRYGALIDILSRRLQLHSLVSGGR
ncbi:flagellar basal body rod protein FlgB [Caulobacter sp. DWR1-3-2b1]|uniref:flagellar basal body rod protein FlgB n=1 Tax=Caulobacter sp. DWR1-3-2b1 TaxID=2804670 RepID=UPI003CE9DE88